MSGLTRSLRIAAFAIIAANAQQTGSRPDEIGVASWYGVPFHGRLTANGEIYNMDHPTAAHRTLPFGTVVRVHNLGNNRTFDVRINDRGPFVADRVIDLSRVAAQNLDMPGTTRVRLEVVRAVVTRGPQFYAIQTGLYGEKQEAQKIARDLRQKYDDTKVIWRDLQQSWAVLVGSEQDITAAETLARKLSADGVLGFIVRSDPE